MTDPVCLIMRIFEGLEHSENFIYAHGWCWWLVVDLLKVSVGPVLHLLAKCLGHLWEDVGHVGCWVDCRQGYKKKFTLLKINMQIHYFIREKM